MFAFINFIRKIASFLFGASRATIETATPSATTTDIATPTEATETTAPAAEEPTVETTVEQPTPWHLAGDAVTSHIWEGGKATFHPAGTRYAVWGAQQQFDSAVVDHTIGCWHVQHNDGRQAVIVTNQPMAGWQLESVGVAVAVVVFGDVVAAFGTVQYEYTNSHKELEIRVLASREFAHGNFALHFVNRALQAGWKTDGRTAHKTVTTAWQQEDGKTVTFVSQMAANVQEWILEDESDLVFIASQYE